MATPGVRSVDQLPELLRESVIQKLTAGVPLRAISQMCNISIEALSRYRAQVIIPSLGVLPQFGAIKPDLQMLKNQPLSDEVVKQSSACVDKAKVRGEVQQAVIALRQRAEGVLTRVESRPDETFSGREWAAVATLAARMLETQGRITGELTDRVAGSDINIQIVMPASTASAQDTVTIDVDVVKALESD